MSFSFGASPFVRKPFLFGGWGDWSIPGVSLIHPEARYDINFAAGQWFGALPSDLVVSRASEALTLTPGGSYANFASNTARITGSGLMIEEARTNSIRNPRGSGAVAGTPGTIPAWWQTPNLLGMSREIVGTGIQDGLPYVDIRVYGTAIATQGSWPVLYPEGQQQIAAASGQTWTFSMFCYLVAGTAPSGLAADIVENNSSGNGINSSVDVSFNSATSLAQAFRTSTHTLTNESTAFINARIVANFTNGASYDFTIRIAAPLLRQATFAGSLILNADGVTNAATTQPADVVYLPISGIGTEYTVYAETGVLASYAAGNSPLEMYGDFDNRARIDVTQTTNGPAIRSAGTAVLDGSVSEGSGVARKIAMRVKGGDNKICCNTTLGPANTAAALALAPNKIYLGSAVGGTSLFLNHFLPRIAIIPRALSDAELQAITT